MRCTTTLLAAIATLAWSGSAGAQTTGAATVKVGQDPTHGRYLTDAEGRALYLFTADERGQGEKRAKSNCSAECLDAWPAVLSDGQPKVGPEADAALLGTIDHQGQQQVTYAGWPLYYFEKDQGPGKATGQEIESFGGEWYLVTPTGEKLESKGTTGSE